MGKWAFDDEFKQLAESRAAANIKNPVGMVSVKESAEDTGTKVARSNKELLLKVCVRAGRAAPAARRPAAPAGCDSGAPPRVHCLRARLCLSCRSHGARRARVRSGRTSCRTRRRRTS